jgi:hypothetical protein
MFLTLECNIIYTALLEKRIKYEVRKNAKKWKRNRVVNRISAENTHYNPFKTKEMMVSEQKWMNIYHHHWLIHLQIKNLQDRVFVSNQSPQWINVFCKNLCLLSHKTFFTSNSLQRILFSYQITTSSPTPQISISKQNDWRLLNQSSLDYLSRTGQLHSLRNSSSIVEFCISYLINTILTYSRSNYIRPNQSCLYSYERRQKQAQQEYENIMDIV